MSEVLIDNATIFSTASIFTRVKNELRIRPINLLSLSSLIDSLVFFEDIILDEKALSFWSNEVPIDWIIPIEEIVSNEKVTFKGSDISLESFLASAENFFALDGVLKIERKTNIRADYLSYDGFDFFQGENHNKEIWKINKILKEEWDWVYNGSDSRHIDSVYASWRGVQYAEYCSKKGYSYVPHEIRSAFFEKYHFYENWTGFQKLSKKIVKEIKQRIQEKREDHEELLEEVLPFSEKSFTLWQNMKMPIFLPLVLRKSSTIYDVFEQTLEYRNKAKPFRNEIIKLHECIMNSEYEKVDKILDNLFFVIENIDEFKDAPKVKWSIACGYPSGLSISVGGEKKFKKKYTSFIRDLYQAKTIPYTYINDITKLFPIKFAYWHGLFKDG